MYRMENVNVNNLCDKIASRAGLAFTDSRMTFTDKQQEHLPNSTSSQSDKKDCWHRRYLLSLDLLEQVLGPFQLLLLPLWFAHKIFVAAQEQLLEFFCSQVYLQYISQARGECKDEREYD